MWVFRPFLRIYFAIKSEWFPPASLSMVSQVPYLGVVDRKPILQLPFLDQSIGSGGRR